MSIRLSSLFLSSFLLFPSVVMAQAPIAFTSHAAASNASTTENVQSSVIAVASRADQPSFEGTYSRIPYSLTIIPRSELMERSRFTEDVKGHTPRFTSKASAVFTSPAHFPRHGFGVCGAQMEQEGLLIYEGMTVACGQNGEYEVRFNTEVPLTTVVLRLQLVVKRQNEVPASELGTITLPPMTLIPPPSVDGHEPSRTYFVAQQGYSHLLRDLMATEAGEWSIARRGTARFGSIPE